MPASHEDRLLDELNFPLGKDTADSDSDDSALGVSGIAQIKISGSVFTKEILTVNLEQSIDGHHVLEVVLVGESELVFKAGGFSDKEVDSLIGAPITLSIGTSEDGIPDAKDAELEFIGVITRVRFDNEVGGLSRAAIIAHSPTIKMDGTRRYAVHMNMTPADVVKKLLNNHKVAVKTTETFGTQQEYLLQHNETDFAFLMRRAGSAGMFAFYDSGKFQIVKNPRVNELQLTWGENLGAFKVGYGVQANAVSVRGWDYKKKQAVVGDSSADRLSKKASDLAKTVLKASTEMFTGDPQVFVKALGSEKAIVDAQASSEAGDRVNRTVVGHGESTTAKVTVGSNVEIKNTGATTDGKYLVTRVTHTISAGTYRNRFACSLLSSAYPTQKYRLTEPPPMFTAIVSNIEDPDGLGRVKVKTPWSDQQESFWARVVAPGNGSERGTMFLPEVDDEVLVAFERGNPEVPLVLGGLWNGKDKPPLPGSDAVKDGKVQQRIIKSRSGLTVLLDDKQNEESVQIVLVDGKTMIDLRGGNKPVITINSENGIKITATESIELDAGKDLTMKAGGNIKLDGRGNVDIKAGSNATVKATSNLELSGMQTKLAGQVKTEVTGGAQLEVKGSGQVAIKGAMVMIN